MPVSLRYFVLFMRLCCPLLLSARFLFLSVFLDHLGIATVDLEFQQDPEAEYGVCESKTTYIHTST